MSKGHSTYEINSWESVWDSEVTSSQKNEQSNMSPSPKEPTQLLLKHDETSVNSNNAISLKSEQIKQPKPSIFLTPDPNGDDQNFVDDSTQTNLVNTRAHSFNSLLHWGHSRPKDYRECLTNKYSELPGEILVIELPVHLLLSDPSHQKTMKLGLSLAGNRDLNQMSVFVCGIRPESIIDRDGRIEIGDQILEVNGHVLHGLSHLNAAPIIRSVYVDITRGISKNFQKSKMNSIDFVINRHPYNIYLMAANVVEHQTETSSRTSNHSSVETSLSLNSIPQDKMEKIKPHMNTTHFGFGAHSQTAVTEQTLTVTLQRGSQGFGFVITEGDATSGDGIYVKQIVEGGVAHKNGILHPGDRIISVNKHNARNASYDTILKWIQSTKQELRLRVSRWSPPHKLNEANLKCQSAPQLLYTFNKFNSLEFLQDKYPHSLLIPRLSFNSPQTKLKPYKRRTSFAELLSPSHQIGQLQQFNSSLLGRADNRTNSLSSFHLNDLTLPAPSRFLKRPPIGPEHISTYVTGEAEESSSVRPIRPSAETTISIGVDHKMGLGIGFIGGCETALNVLAVHELYASGMAVLDGRLRPGDRILYVNGISLTGLPFLEAINCIQMAYINTSLTSMYREEPELEDVGCEERLPRIHLTVYRPDPYNEKWYDQEVTVELLKKPGKGLGICISDRCVYLKSQKSPEKNGGLQLTSQINESTPCAQKSYGVIITELVKGSTASNDGRLMPNDQILSVNDQDTSNLTSEILGALLKTAQNKITIKVGRLKHQVVSPNSTSRIFHNPAYVIKG